MKDTPSLWAALLMAVALISAWSDPLSTDQSSAAVKTLSSESLRASRLIELKIKPEMTTTFIALPGQTLRPDLACFENGLEVYGCKVFWTSDTPRIADFDKESGAIRFKSEGVTRMCAHWVTKTLGTRDCIYIETLPGRIPKPAMLRHGTKIG